jgi:hypothetical protein
MKRALRSPLYILSAKLSYHNLPSSANPIVFKNTLANIKLPGLRKTWQALSSPVGLYHLYPIITQWSLVAPPHRIRLLMRHTVPVVLERSPGDGLEKEFALLTALTLGDGFPFVQLEIAPGERHKLNE